MPYAIPTDYQSIFSSLIVMLSFFALIAIIIRLPSKSKKQNELLKKFQETERSANMAENKPLPSNLVFKINTSPLHLEDFDTSSLEPNLQEQIDNYKHKILSMNGGEYVLPDPKTSNTTLKQLYGPTTLQYYINLEQRYNSYVQRLVSFSEVLYNNHFYKEATVIINELLHLKSNSSKPYIILIDIYYKRNEIDKLVNFKEFVETEDFFNTNEYCKKKILSKIYDILQNDIYTK